MDDLLREFLAETGEHLDTVDVELVRLERDPSDEAILRNIFRLVHTIKGTCGFLGLPRLEALAHSAETVMGQLRSGSPVTSDLVTLVLATIDRIKLIIGELERIGAEPVGSDADLITALDYASRRTSGTPAADRQDTGAEQSGTLDQVLLRPLRSGEVPLHVLEKAFQDTPGPTLPPREAHSAETTRPLSDDRTRPESQTVRVGLDTLEHLMTTVSELVLTRNQLLDVARRTKDDDAFKAPLQRLSQVTAELQDGIMKTRMQPIGNAWAKLPRLLRDLSAELGKQLELTTRGAETELDRQVLEIIRDPLTHMVRNCAAHGIEAPAERVALGKRPHGTVTLSAFQEGGAITIEVSDDGRGLDLDAIRSRVVQTDLAGPAELARMTDAQVAHFIFHPGFSTTVVANAVSGRGVGMDVVKTNVELIGGDIEILSEPGRGTTFKIKLPLTLAIVAALIVRSADHRFAIPQVAIQELVRVRPGSDHQLERINGACLLRMRGALLPVVDLSTTLELREPATRDVGFVVVTEIGRQRFGILVDAVLETEEIVVKPMCQRLRHLQLFSGNTILGDGTVALILDPNGIARRVGAALLRDSREPGAQTNAPAAVEDVTTLLVFRGGDRALKAMPLSLVARLEEIDATSVERAGGRANVQYRGRLMPLLPVDERTEIRREGLQPVIVVSANDVLIGLAVDEVVDVVEERLEIRGAPGRPDLVGTAIVRGRATEIVDLADYLPRAVDGWSEAARNRQATILLADDNPFFREMLTPVLKAAGYQVRVAGSAEDALQAALQHDPAALVTDLRLADRSGVGLIETLRRRPETAALPIVALAARADDDLALRAGELGIRRTVSKFDRTGLLAALSGLESRRARDLAA